MKKIFYIFVTVIIASISYFIGLQKSQQYSKADLVIVKAYILHDVSITDSQVKRLDIDKDGRVTSRDYVLIKNELDEK